MRMQTREDLSQKISFLLKSKDQVLIAIDGHSGSGKSSLAHELSQIFECNLFHMDDFFLREEQRTAERFRQPGGNVDYERFKEEVLCPLTQKHPFQYRTFDCQTMSFGKTILVQPKKLNIVEGSYSHHPAFQDFYDYRIFLDITPEEQSKRILQRNGVKMHQRFVEEWIPLENAYFETFKIKEKSDLILSL